jgi:hypothetical protein
LLNHPVQDIVHRTRQPTPLAARWQASRVPLQAQVLDQTH